MWRKRCPTGASLIRTRFVWRASKPSIGEFMTWWRFPTHFGMWRKRLVNVPIVQLLSVHVRMRSHRASLDWSIHSQRQMPRIKSILALHLSILFFFAPNLCSCRPWYNFYSKIEERQQPFGKMQLLPPDFEETSRSTHSRQQKNFNLLKCKSMGPPTEE